MAIRLMIDSASDISKEEANRLGIFMMPMVITFGDEDYLDGENLLPNEFYEKLIENDELPKTSQINPYRFEEKFEKLTENGDRLIVITISSKLSGTYASAKQAAENFKDKVFVIDSLNACIGERLLCQYAIRLIEQGLNVNEIVNELDKVKLKINVMAMLNTLEYLKKGGRISSVAAFAGELFSLKPVVAVVDGEVKLVGKARGSKNGKNLLNSLVEKKGIDFSMPCGVIWSGTDKSMLDKYVRDSESIWKDEINNIPEYIVGSTIGTHVGPGAIGVAFFEK